MVTGESEFTLLQTGWGSTCEAQQDGDHHFAGGVEDCGQ